MTVGKSIRSLEIETKSKSIKMTTIQRKSDSQNALELLTEERLKDDINILHEITSKGLDYSWELITFLHKKNDTIRKKIKEFEVNDLNLDMKNLERQSEIRNQALQRTEILSKETYPTEKTIMTSELIEVSDDSSFEDVCNLNEIERELYIEIIHLKKRTSNALECSWYILQFAQYEKKKLNEKLKELESSMGSNNVRLFSSSWFSQLKTRKKIS